MEVFKVGVAMELQGGVVGVAMELQGGAVGVEVRVGLGVGLVNKSRKPLLHPGLPLH